MVKTLPGFNESALAELLSRQDQLLTALNAALRREAWTGDERGFPSAYERLITSELDPMELFGISIAREHAPVLSLRQQGRSAPHEHVQQIPLSRPLGS